MTYDGLIACGLLFAFALYAIRAALRYNRDQRRFDAMKDDAERNR